VPCCAAIAFARAQPKDWSISMNKKERRLALATALQSAAADTVVVDGIAAAAGGLGATMTPVQAGERAVVAERP
jgi:ribosomal protein L4